MTVCVRCHRPLKRPSEDGYGPVCRKAATPIAAHERDLFGFNITAAAESAAARVHILIESLTASAHIAIRHEFAAARRRLGVWAS